MPIYIFKKCAHGNFEFQRSSEKHNEDSNSRSTAYVEEPTSSNGSPYVLCINFKILLM